MGKVISPEAVCEEARRCRKAKRLLKAFETAVKEAEFASNWYKRARSIDANECVKRTKAEYKRTRANLLAFMGV